MTTLVTAEVLANLRKLAADRKLRVTEYDATAQAPRTIYFDLRERTENYSQYYAIEYTPEQTGDRRVCLIEQSCTAQTPHLTPGEMAELAAIIATVRETPPIPGEIGFYLNIGTMYSYRTNINTDPVH
jgi:hypothetical protein